MSGRRGKRGGSEVSLAQRLGSSGAASAESVLPGGDPGASAGRRGRPKKSDQPRSGREAAPQAAGAPPPPQPTPPGSVLPGGRATASRSQLRQERKKAKQRRALIVVAVIAAIAVVAGLVAWWVSRDGDEGAGAPVDQRTEQTLTMVLADQSRPVLDGAVLVADPATGNGSSLFVPNRLFVDGVAGEGIPFADTTMLGNPEAPGDAMRITLDVLMDGTWRLSPAGMATLVDAVGGVTVDVDVEVLRREAGATQVVIPAGDDQQLNGQQAVAFAVYQAPGEPEQARLARFSQVLIELLSALPDDQAVVAAALDQLGQESQATVPDSVVATLLVSLGAALRENQARVQTLPVTPLETGGPREAYSLDEEAFAPLRLAAFPESLPPDQPGGRVRVLVENGVGTPGLEQLADDRLTDAGFLYISGGNANAFGREKTVVLIPDTSEEQRARGAAVARALGVPVSAVQVSGTGQQVAEVIVILGADFQEAASKGA